MLTAISESFRVGVIGVLLAYAKRLLLGRLFAVLWRLSRSFVDSSTRYVSHYCAREVGYDGSDPLDDLAGISLRFENSQEDDRQGCDQEDGSHHESKKDHDKVSGGTIPHPGVAGISEAAHFAFFQSGLPSPWFLSTLNFLDPRGILTQESLTLTLSAP